MIIRKAYQFFGFIQKIGLSAHVLLLATRVLAGPSEAAELTRLQFEGQVAYRLSDGRTEAVLVPAYGRVMRYGFTKGENVLWNSARTSFGPNDWKNHGGDKMWLAPQHQWPALIQRDFPPDPTFDGTPYEAQVLPGGGVRMRSGVSAAFGARLVREFRVDPDGDFVIDQTVEKVAGPPLSLSIWSVTQIVPPEAIFLALNPHSGYPSQLHWMVRPTVPVPVTRLSPTLARVEPTVRSNFKIGVDGAVAAIASVRHGVAFVQRTRHFPLTYPDGTSGRPGFPVELWNNGDASAYCNELELLSPLHWSPAGSTMHNVVRWSLRRLPSARLENPAVRATIALMLGHP